MGRTVGDEIELISDGDGLAVIGDATAVERFLSSAGVPSKDLQLHQKLGSALNAGQVGAERAATFIASQPEKPVNIVSALAEVDAKIERIISLAGGALTQAGYERPPVKQRLNEARQAMSVNGYFDRFGGRYVAEVLRRPLDELEAAFAEAMADSAFLAELEGLRRDFFGRPTPLLFAENATRLLDGQPLLNAIDRVNFY